MKTCTSKEEIRCFYLTKDNYEEFLEEAYPSYKADYIEIEVTDKAIEVHAYDMIHVSRVFHFGWWVEEYIPYEYPTWIPYSDEEFKEKYKLVDRIEDFPINVEEEVEKYKKTLEFMDKIIP